MADKRKILHLIKSLGRGGAEMLLPEALKLHDKNTFEFHYGYFLPWKDQMVESIRLQGGQVTCFHASNNVLLMLKVFKVVKYIKDNNIELVHAHLPWAGILARVVGKICNVPVIYTEHNKQERYHIGTRLFNTISLEFASVVVAVSDDVAKSIRKYKPNLKIPIRTILNGVNTLHFDRELSYAENIREKFNIPADAPLIGTIAVFRFQKRLDLWMEISVRILEENPTVHFMIVGDGPLKESLIQKRAELGLTERIHMPGLEVDVRPYIKTFDIYMMSSIFEGLPVALLEAMSMQCPIISTDAGGIKEVVRNEIEGLLCDINEPFRVVEFARILLDDSNLRREYGAFARKRVIDSFSMIKMVKELEELYVEIM